MKTQKNTPPNRRPVNRNSAPSPAFSYYGNRVSGTGPAAGIKKKVKRSLKWQYLPSYIALAVILGSLVYASGLDMKPRVELAENTSTVLLRPTDSYQQAAERQLKRSVFNRSKLLINTKSIEAALMTEFPELKTVGLTIPLTNRQPILKLKSVEPRLMLITTSGRFVIDERGRAVAKVDTDEMAAALNLPPFQDQSGLAVSLGEVTLASREVAFISELTYQLRNKAADVESMVLPPLLNEVHLGIKNQPYYVKFNMLGDARLQAGTFIAAKARLESQGIKPAEYIDVRVDEKVFYK